MVPSTSRQYRIDRPGSTASRPESKSLTITVIDVTSDKMGASKLESMHWSPRRTANLQHDSVNEQGHLIQWAGFLESRRSDLN